jgi:hypothetical protein
MKGDAIMQNYSIILDIWEGQAECNEAAFKAGGVAGLIIRINNMAGGHHLDSNFTKQWSESQDFNPAPYFVYNPWVSGQANFDWLNTNMPAACPVVFVDTEVRMAGLSAAAYGAQYAAFIQLCRAKWKTIIYTGAGGLDLLTPWPKDLDYWWAAYPFSMYPSTVTTVTWAQLNTMITALTWPPYNGAASPGPIKMWQCSGDRLIVPGNSHVMDIDVFPGTAADYKAWLGYTGVIIHPALTLEERVANLESEAKKHGWNIP